MRVLLALAVLVSLLRPVSAEEPQAAAEVTEPGRSLDRALDVVLGGTGLGGEGGKRTIVLVLDPTAALQAAGFGDKLSAALARNASHLAECQIGILKSGAEGAPALPPTADRAAVAAKAAELLAAPGKAIQNVYADVRAAAGALGGKQGSREIVLVTLENGDCEDDVEATVSELRRAKAKCSVICRETFLSDSYWFSHGTKQPARGTTMASCDGPFVDVPWGWLFQQSSGNEISPSGFAVYGLTRLAAGTGGKVFLVSENVAATHTCFLYGRCLFCSGDHIPVGEVYENHRVRALGPPSTPRDEALSAAARDPWYRAVLAAWRKASEEGLTRSWPSVEFSGPTLKPERRPIGAWAPLTGNGPNFAQYAARADKAIKACDRIIGDLEGDLSRIGEGEGLPRYRAIADYVRVMLHVTRVNCLGYAAWCQEAGPVTVGRKEGEEVLPPEQPLYGEDMRPIGVSFTDFSLCHGVKPFQQVHLPGGAAMKEHLKALDHVVSEYLVRYAGTPFAVALRRSGISEFHPTVVGKILPPPPRTPPQGAPAEKSTTDTDRPPREGGGTTTGGGATTTGGK